MKFHLTTVVDKLYYPLCVCDSAPQTFHKLFFTSFQFPHTHHPLQPLIKSDHKSKWPSPHSVPKRQTYFSQSGMLFLDHELLHLRAPASDPFYLCSVFRIWNMECVYIHKKQSLLILKSLFLWMKKTFRSRCVLQLGVIHTINPPTSHLTSMSLCYGGKTCNMSHFIFYHLDLY